MDGSWRGEDGRPTPGEASLSWTIWATILEGAPMLMTITPGYRARLQRLGHLTKNADQNSMRPLLLSILEPGSRPRGKTLPNCDGRPLPKPYRVRRASSPRAWVGTTLGTTLEGGELLTKPMAAPRDHINMSKR